MFWDEAACDKLLRERYPWFMTTWQTLGNSTVLKSGMMLCRNGTAYSLVWHANPLTAGPWVKQYDYHRTLGSAK